MSDPNDKKSLLQELQDSYLAFFAKKSEARRTLSAMAKLFEESEKKVEILTKKVGEISDQNERLIRENNQLKERIANIDGRAK